MKWFDIIAGIASILGLLVALFTLWLVERLPHRLRQLTANHLLTTKIDEILAIPTARRKLPVSSRREVEFLIRTVRRDYLAWMPWKDTELRELLNDLEAEVNGRCDRSVVQNHLAILRGHILGR